MKETFGKQKKKLCSPNPRAFLLLALLASTAAGFCNSARAGQCANADLTRAILEVSGREPNGQGLEGECDPTRYTVTVKAGQEAVYDDVKAAVEAVWKVVPAGRTRGGTGVCNDPWVTRAFKEVMGREPFGAGNGDECNISLYGNGSWSSYADLQHKIRAAAAAGCRDPWVSSAIREVLGRHPVGFANANECNISLYGNGSWSSYADLKNKVQAGIFSRRGIADAATSKCWGAQGSACDALLVGVGPYKVGRTNRPDGTYDMWISVGSIMHDNCCLNNPGGKMCSGNEWGHNNTCVKEWDKAFWNATNGRAWAQNFNPNRTPDLRLVNNPRSSRALDGSALIPYETAETRNFYAPRGQALDVGDEAFCASGRAQMYEEKVLGMWGTGKKWIVCL